MKIPLILMIVCSFLLFSCAPPEPEDGLLVDQNEEPRIPRTTSILDITPKIFETKGWYPESIASGDLDNDGFGDIVYSTGHRIEAVFGSNEVFQEKYFTDDHDNSTAATFVAVGDLNSDGRDDVVAAGSSKFFYYQMNSNNRWFGGTPLEINIQGMGTGFQDDINSLKLVDFNKDGKLDIVSINGANSSGAVVIVLGNGNGTFQAPNLVGIESSSTDFAMDDFNGDGYLDVAAPMYWAGKIAVLINDKNGSFLPAVNIALSGVRGQISSLDYDHDGKVDLVVSDADNVLKVLKNVNGTNFTSSLTINLTHSHAKDIKNFDFNNDGFRDIQVAHGSADSISMFLSDKSGGFLPEEIVYHLDSVEEMTFVDTNGDKIKDLGAIVDRPNATGRLYIYR